MPKAQNLPKIITEALPGKSPGESIPSEAREASYRSRAKASKKPKTTAEGKALFLDAYEQTAIVTDSAKIAGVSLRTIYRWRDKDPTFAEAWSRARVSAEDLLSDEATYRATKGREQDIYHKGEVVGTKRVASDVLLIFLLKAINPRKYRDRYEPPPKDPDASTLPRDPKDWTVAQLDSMLEQVARLKASKSK